MTMMALVIVLLGVLGAAVWQIRRYQRIRREVLGERQPMFYPSGTFHAVTFVRTEPGRAVIDDLRTLRRAIEVPGGGLVVYAGQCGPAMVESAQVPNEWSGLLLVQYPSREAFDRLAASPEYAAALSHFAAVYTHGVLRHPGVNLVLPLGLLLLRLGDVVRRAPSPFPFIPLGDDAPPRMKAKLKELERLDALRPVNAEAVVIFNLIKPGTKEQRAADRSYARKMMSAMAEGGYGPMHMGRAVTVEGSADFAQFAAVYYPGIDFVRNMVGSTFMGRIAGDKQLGDSLAVLTVPVLSKL